MSSTSSSSSFFSDDEEEHFLNVLLETKFTQINTSRHGYAEQVVPYLTNDEFIDNFRISRVTAKYLANQFKQSNFYPRGQHRLHQFKCILVMCWFVTHAHVTVRQISAKFDLPSSTVYGTVERVLSFLSSLADNFIKWPDENEQEDISKEFIDMGLPNVAGVLGITYLKIEKFNFDMKKYQLNDNCYAIQVQVVCDHKRQIRDVYVEREGILSATDVLKKSSLFLELENRCGNKYLIGDSAYPCLTNLLTPYKCELLSTTQKQFNECLFQYRSVINQTFHLLKTRFCHLNHIKLKRMDAICALIRGCCVLYNLSLSCNDSIQWSDVMTHEQESLVTVHVGADTPADTIEGCIRREEIIGTLNNY